VLERPESEYSPDPHITRQDVFTALGPDAGDLMAEAEVDIDELIRLINAETTLLPAIVVPDEASEDRTGGPAEQEEPERALATATRTWKKRFLKGTVMAVLITLTGGGAAALAMNKSVTLEVDGKQQTVHSFGDTVGEVLEDAGLSVGAHDALSPSPQTEVGDGGVIKLERGRKLNLVVDGVERESWVRATNVREALGQLGLEGLVKPGTWFSVAPGSQVPLGGMTLQVKTLKHITLFDGGKQPRELTTNAVTIQEFLAEQKLTVGPDDEVEGGADAKLVDGAEVHISRTGVSMVELTETIEPEVKEVEDPELELGKTVVEDEGTPGEELVTYKITKRNGAEIAREEVSAKVLKKPEPKIVRIGTKEPEQPRITDGAVWDRLAQCESTGNWSINTGNGYYGGLQFDKSTWDAYGGEQYAAYPHQATREQQIAVATKVRDSRGGYGAWPHCSSQLGL
jgi:uncharacterized protein YabE (DUF348 family)